MSNNNQETITSQIYHVQVIETDASIRCGLKPFTIYRLIIGSNQLQLKADHNNKDDDRLNVLFEWPYKYVRRYGYTSNSISFEAGSKCQTGEGLFIFRNKKSKILYNQITNNIDRIKRQKKSSSMIADDDLIVVVNDDDNNNNNNAKRQQQCSSSSSSLSNHLLLCRQQRQDKNKPIVCESSTIINDDDDDENDRQKSNLIEQQQQQQQIPHLLINDCPYAQVIKNDRGKIF